MLADVRTHPRDTVSTALDSFLAALRLKRDVRAIALTTEDGRLIASSGEGVDLERMGMVGATSFRFQVEWNEHTLYTHRFELNDLTLCLTTSGVPIVDDVAIGGLCRILAVTGA